MRSNAVEAALGKADVQHRPWVRIRWTVTGRELALEIDDNGPGLTDSANLFVPFYTTKPAGTGIGHALAKQIASGHAGTLTLVNREDASGSKPRPEARRNGGDWRKRVVDFVAENADQPPPGNPFLLAQGRVHVRKDEELMRHTRNAEEERRRDQRISPVPPEAAG